MRKPFLLQYAIIALVIFEGGCSVSDNYCCTSNDQCVPVHGTSTSCTTAVCGKCVEVDPLQITVTEWKDATVGETYEVELTASGGVTPYEWEGGLARVNDNDNDNKLGWLVLIKDENDNSKAWLRNDTINGQPQLPSNPTTDSDALTIEVTVKDNTRHGTAINRVDNSGAVFSHEIKIYPCTTEGADCGSSCNGLQWTPKTCQSGICITGIVQNCDDGNVCTSDTCSAGSGCIHSNMTNGASCGVCASCSTGNCVYDSSHNADCGLCMKCVGLGTCGYQMSSEDLKNECQVGSCFTGYCNGAGNCEVAIIKDIAAGRYHTCAVTSLGGVRCWGTNGTGQLGDGTTTQRNTPVVVSGLTSVVSAITSGYWHTCALASSGGVTCWGYNADGELGDGTTTDKYTPVHVSVCQ